SAGRPPHTSPRSRAESGSQAAKGRATTVPNGGEVMASRRIVLTGVTRGLGRALLTRFAALGHAVAGCGRSAADLVALRQQSPPPHDFAVVDVADRAAVEAWANDLLRRFGTPDLLLNNAALINHNAPLWQVPADEFDLLIDVNIKGVANVIRTLVP